MMINNPLELYKHLDQSNCRRCLLPSCMAFSVAVIQGQKKLSDCPCLSTEKINELSSGIVQKKSMKEEQDAYLASLQEEIAQQDLNDIAHRLTLPLNKGTIGIRCLGKYFLMDKQGRMTSECHCNNWVHI
ncbi:MAG: Fe-S cluster protein, partial [Candidatus Electrothrix sp. MAN1_4]|nr:Fe-S cluster protein [Candidatus Electrothrix sp. MAN1_4]